jgi:hypothetical protein
MKAKSSAGQVMIFDLAQHLQEYLIEHNHKPLSFYEEMMLRKEGEQKAQKATVTNQICSKTEFEICRKWRMKNKMH